MTWAGNPWSLTGLCFLNILLIVITAGIYWFWARAEYRRYMWQMVRVQDEPLEYTGTGKELLIGYLKLFLFVFLPLIALTAGAQIAFGPKNPAVAGAIAIVYAAVFFLYLAGIFRAHRYILSRTRWRGIAFGLEGNAGAYGWTAVWTGLLTALTLGWLYPWRTVALRRRLTRAMGFGSAAFDFEGGSGRLYAPFAILWVGFVLAYGALGAVQVALMKLQLQQPGAAQVHLDKIPPVAFLLIAAAIPFFLAGWSWFEARKLNVFAGATKAGGLGFSLTATGGSVLWLTLTNLLILVLSVGILRPVAQARRLRYLVTRLSLSGTADLDEVMRGAEEEGTPGAGLEAAFSIEIF